MEANSYVLKGIEYNGGIFKESNSEWENNFYWEGPFGSSRTRLDEMALSGMANCGEKKSSGMGSDEMLTRVRDVLVYSQQH